MQVLHGVDLTVEAGEVVGLVGDNGAGKSTLMKSITGVYTTDRGKVSFDGTDVTHLDPGERREMGIEMIYQDLALAPQQDVANNIFLGREPTKRLFGVFPSFVNKQKIDTEAQEMLDRLGVHVPSVHIPVGMLSGGQQQTIAIARALTFKPKLVIMGTHRRTCRSRGGKRAETNRANALRGHRHDPDQPPPERRL